MTRIAVDPAIAAFLDMIAVSEIGRYLLAASDDGYNVVVGGSLFHGYAHHPRIIVNTQYGRSDAAGRYQMMAGVPGHIVTDTWDWAHRVAGVHDFTPESQDTTCVYLLRHHNAYDDILAGNIAQAIMKCNVEWASLPGSPDGQGTNRLDYLLTEYTAAKELYADPS